MEPDKKSSGRRIIVFFCLFLALGFLACFAFAAEIKTFFTPHSIEIKNNKEAQAQQVSEPKALDLWPFNNNSTLTANFLLLGAPGQGNDAPDLTDTILLARLDKNKIYLFSLPRDLIVKIPGSENYTKLNALYAFNKNNTGQEFAALIQKTQDITGLTIDHYIFVDLQTVRQLVDIFGGVNVLVAKDIIDESFPGPNHSFETFKILAGWRYLNGETALKYMRSRHSAAGDFDRVVRQQEVLQALKQKVLALHFWDIGKFLEIYNTLSSNIKSDLSLWQMKNYWQAIKDIPGENVIKNELDNENLITTGPMTLGNQIASVVKPKAGIENYEAIKKYINEIINK
ncbi:MAG TPA: LCP family protein [Candidatus Portnoybacteria bacterium]|nr:LCP family protein [Candidatus Portnoybacteria bacterium]